MDQNTGRLSGVKPGDFIAVTRHSGAVRCERVVKVTPSGRVITENDRTFTAYGEQYPRSHFMTDSVSAQRWTEEHAALARDHAAKAKATKSVERLRARLHVCQMTADEARAVTAFVDTLLGAEKSTDQPGE